MIITLDGPAGTGKSSVAQAIARALNFDFLDTGAMYRALGLYALEKKIDLNDENAVAVGLEGAQVDFVWEVSPPGVLLNGKRVEGLIRTPQATSAASWVARVPRVREVMVNLQRQIGINRGNLVTEGRDQGTVVFPDARYKFFLDATCEERANRRFKQLQSEGKPAKYDEILLQIQERDHRDRTRAVGPLKPAPGALVIDTTHMSIDQVIEAILQQVQNAGKERGL
jgi:cytidylate kinase